MKFTELPQEVPSTHIISKSEVYWAQVSKSQQHLLEWTVSLLSILEPPNNCPGLIRTGCWTWTKLIEENKRQ